MDTANTINIFAMMEKRKVEELVMKEVEFIKYCVELDGIKRIFRTRGSLTPDPQQESINILMINMSIWREYWRKEINDDFRSLLNYINWHLGSTRTVLLMFLAILKTISTIVPSENNDSSCSELEEACEVWKIFFQSEETDQETEESVNISLLKNRIEKNIKHSSKTNVYAATWILLEFWMNKYRREWLNQVKMNDGKLFTTKQFFNRIFYHSIENLTTRLYKLGV
jgi:hypothetical protein